VAGLRFAVAAADPGPTPERLRDAFPLLDEMEP